MTGVVVVGALAQAAAWWVIRRRGAGLWTTTPPVLGVAGVAAVVVARPALSGDLAVASAVLAGGVVGALLYIATFAFVRLAAPRWRAFDEQTRDLYRSRTALPPVLALVVAAGVAAVGEELFWRGLVREWARDAFGVEGRGAVAAWAGSILVNLSSVNLAILAAAIVGGGVWTTLAVWSGGVLASMVCHACWTALMVARPVIAGGSQR